MADTIQFFYFDGRARGEIIRMLLTAANQPFEDHRFSMEEWLQNPKMKEATPFGQLPYVIYKGKKYGQSIALASFFAKKFGFYGQTDEDALRLEEVMHLVNDIRIPHMREWYFNEGEKKAEKVKELKTDIFPRYMKYFEDLLAENGDKGLFVGDSITVADMCLCDFLETVQDIDSEALEKFSLLKKLCENVRNMPALKAYMENRPKRVM